MKRLLVIAILMLLPTALLAQVADRDVLLTPDGTLYTIESTVNNGSVPAAISRFLTLTIQRGNEQPIDTIVPDSLTAGTHWRPSLAFDPDSKTLLVFWLKMPNAMSSQLLLTSYANGHWQPAVSIDNQPFHLRYNLRVGITRRVAQLQRDGSFVDVPALLVHAVWWDETGYGETARYALISISKGVATPLELDDLNTFAISPPMFPNETSAQFNPEILKHPAFVDNGTQDSVDVIFGDPYYNLFNRVTLKPIADGRIHIPIGVHPGGPRIGAPMSFAADWNGRISTITSPHDNSSLLLYNTDAGLLHYIIYTDGAWSAVKTLPITEKFSADAAVTALVRMMSQ